MHVALIAIVLLAPTPDQLGKTDSQVIKMGRQAWGDYHAERQGSSTVDMCNGERIFGEVLKRRNDRLLPKATALTRAHIKTIRQEMPNYIAGIYEVGSALSGGGTMWNIIHAGILADTEEVVGHIVGVRSAKVKSRKVSDVTKVLSDLKLRVAEERTSIEQMPSGGGLAAANGGLAQANKAWKILHIIAAKRPRKDSDAILSCCISAVDDVREFFGEDR